MRCSDPGRNPPGAEEQSLRERIRRGGSAFRRHFGERLFEGSEIERAAWRQRYDRRRLRIRGSPGRATRYKRAQRALDDCPPVEPAHLSPFASWRVSDAGADPLATFRPTGGVTAPFASRNVTHEGSQRAPSPPPISRGIRYRRDDDGAVVPLPEPETGLVGSLWCTSREMRMGSSLAKSVHVKLVTEMLGHSTITP